MLSRSVLRSCSRRSSGFFYRTLVTDVPTSESNSALPLAAKQPTSAKPPRPHLTTAIVLNRSPLITRTPTAFERAFYRYQARIQRALHNPFPNEFYFKQGSPLEARFNIEERKRERSAFGRISGSQNTDGEEGPTLRQLGPQEGEGEVTMPRVHEADVQNDFKSLDRKGKRNLYLLLQSKEGGEEVWRFPRGVVDHGEQLHQAAQKSLLAECGPYMDTWIVGRKPIGMFEPPLPDTLIDETAQRRVTFFYKAHILAGQVRPDGKNICDFAWLTKQEITSRVDEKYWTGVKDMLSDV